MVEKRRQESDPGQTPLTPTGRLAVPRLFSTTFPAPPSLSSPLLIPLPPAKHKSRMGQFTLKRKKSKSELEAEDCLVCPLSPVPQHSQTGGRRSDV